MTRDLVKRVPVVFVLDNLRVGGSELNAVRTAERLDRRRFDLRVVCLSGDGPLTERYRALGVPIVSLPLHSLYGTSMVACGLRFASYLRSEGVQVVHAHDMYSNIFVTPWSRLARTPVVIVSRRWWNSLPNRKLQLGNLVAFRMADAVLANSPTVARSVEMTERVRSDRVWVVTNFVDEEAFVALSEQQRLLTRTEWGVAPGAVVIGCVARLVPIKDHATLLRAFALLREQHVNTHLVLVGDGETRADLEALAVSLGIADTITFVGELRTGQNQHRAFDISTLCSLSEGFPNSLVEAMAAGMPIVATDVGGVPDAVTHGENGLLVQPRNPEALSRALAVLVDNAPMRRTMGDIGRSRAHERFRAQAAVGSLETMYASLLAGAA
jgi:glycosyltransferase involved in cell wall biosynthesis